MELISQKTLSVTVKSFEVKSDNVIEKIILHVNINLFSLLFFSSFTLFIFILIQFATRNPYNKQFSILPRKVCIPLSNRNRSLQTDLIYIPNLDIQQRIWPFHVNSFGMDQMWHIEQNFNSLHRLQIAVIAVRLFVVVVIDEENCELGLDCLFGLSVVQLIEKLLLFV